MNLHVGVLASHRGSALKAISAATADRLKFTSIAVVISNNSDSGALSFAKSKGIACLHLSGTTHGDPATLDHAICSALTEHGVDLVLLLGYMKLLGPSTLSTFKGRILNIHPSLLPKFGGRGMYGPRVHEAVLASGEMQSGATLHLVNHAYDEGPVVDQVAVPVARDDSATSLADRISVAENELIISTLRRIELGELLLPIKGRTGAPQANVN